MSKKDFFRILLKLSGVYVLISMSTVVFQLAGMFPYGDGWAAHTSILFVPTVLFAIFCLLVFYPDLIITRLRLDKGFDNDHIPFEKLDADMIVKVGVVIAGGLLLVQNVAPFFSTSYYLLKASVPGAVERDFMGFNPFDYRIGLITNILNLVVGYLLITNSDHVSKFIVPKKIIN